MTQSTTATAPDQAMAEGSSDKAPPPPPGFQLPDPGVQFEEFAPFGREMVPPTPFPTKTLGTLLSGAISKVAQIVQVPEALAGNSVLAAVALAVQAHGDAWIDDRVHPLSEFWVTVAETGDRKDATDNVALAPIYEHQMQLQTRHQKESADFKIEQEAYERAKAVAIKSNEGNGRDAIKQAIEQLGDAPLSPVGVLKIISDATIEGLTTYLASGQPSVGVFVTEGGQLIGGHGFTQENIIRTATGFSKFWDGKPVGRLRAGDGVTALYNRRVSLHIMMQPVLAPLLIGSALLAGQGLLGRMLITWPESLAGGRAYSGNQNQLPLTVGNCNEVKAYYTRMATLLQVPEPVCLGTRNQLNPRRVPLDADAYKLWRAFYEETELQQAKDGPLRPIKGLASKIAEHAARLAGELALFEKLDCQDINETSMSGGIALAEHYLNEALRFHGLGEPAPQLKQAQELYDWLCAKGRQYVSLVEIYRYGPNGIRDARKARSLVSTLIEHGRMAELPGGLEFEGANRREAFAVRFNAC